MIDISAAIATPLPTFTAAISNNSTANITVTSATVRVPLLSLHPDPNLVRQAILQTFASV